MPDPSRARKDQLTYREMPPAGERRVGRATGPVWTTKRARPLPRSSRLSAKVVARAQEEDRICGARPGASPQDRKKNAACSPCW
jgi:hypothetical protein